MRRWARLGVLLALCSAAVLLHAATQAPDEPVRAAAKPRPPPPPPPSLPLAPAPPPAERPPKTWTSLLSLACLPDQAARADLVEFDAPPLRPQPLARDGFLAAQRLLRLPEPKPEASRELRWRAEEQVRRRQATVYFLHIHKAGGTTLCHTADANRVRTTRECNCLVWDFAAGRATAFHAWTAEQQLTLFRERWLSFVANEMPMGAAPPPPGAGGVAYAVVVRDPLDRVLSHFRHEVGIGSRGFNAFASFEQFVDAVARKTRPPMWLDNFQVRMLTPRALSPADPVEAADAAGAIARLEHQFSAVLVTEDLARTAEQLTVKFGWRRVDLERLRRGSSTHSDARAELAGRPDLIAFLEQRNELDLALHAAARRVAELRMQEPDRREPWERAPDPAPYPLPAQRAALEHQYPECIGKVRWYCNAYYLEACWGALGEAEMRAAIARAHGNVVGEGQGACPPTDDGEAFFVYPLFDEAG